MIGRATASDASCEEDGERRAAGRGDVAPPDSILAGCRALCRFPLRRQPAHCRNCVAGFSAQLVVRE